MKFLAGGFFPLLAAGILVELLTAQRHSLHWKQRLHLSGPLPSLAEQNILCLVPAPASVSHRPCATQPSPRVSLSHPRAVQICSQATAMLKHTTSRQTFYSRGGYASSPHPPPPPLPATWRIFAILATGWGGGEGRPGESDSRIIQGCKIPAPKTPFCLFLISLFPSQVHR